MAHMASMLHAHPSPHILSLKNCFNKSCEGHSRSPTSVHRGLLSPRQHYESIQQPSCCIINAQPFTSGPASHREKTNFHAKTLTLGAASSGEGNVHPDQMGQAATQTCMHTHMSLLAYHSLSGLCGHRQHTCANTGTKALSLDGHGF
jgi:hypothetical protein